MIRIGNIRDIDFNNSDKVYAIVRKMSYNDPNIKQLTALAPSTELYIKCRILMKKNEWNKDIFESMYVPTFISELKRNKEGGLDALRILYRADKEGYNTEVVCFCVDEDMCHRSIIAGILQGYGITVKLRQNKDYTKYFEMFKNLEVG